MITGNQEETKGSRQVKRRRRFFVPSVGRSIEADSVADVEKQVKKINSDNK